MTDSIPLTAGLVILAYLWGSIPTAILVCRAFKMPDPRKTGSGNPGTTNVLRVGNRVAATLTLLGDCGKGFFALLPCILFELSDTTRALCCIATIYGHLFPLFNAFKGGKGVATTLGACLGLYWPLTLVQLCVWLTIASVSRISSLASISAALISPLFIWVAAPQYILPICIISITLLIRHRTNIKSLLSGQEPRL